MRPTNQTFKYGINLFLENTKNLKNRWLAWIFFWSFASLIFSALFQTVTMAQTNLQRVWAVLAIQSSCPVFLLMVYVINKNLEIKPPKIVHWWYGLKECLSKKTLGFAIKFCALYNGFYFGLSVMMFLVLAVLAADSKIALGLAALTQFMIISCFGCLTWPIPSLMESKKPFIEITKEAAKKMLTYWRPLTVYLAIVHTPMAILGWGVIQAIMAINQWPLKIQPENLNQTLFIIITQTAPTAPYLIILGSMLQTACWCTYLLQGYTPTFWNKLESKEAR